MKNKVLFSIALAVFFGLFINLYIRYIENSDYTMLFPAPCNPEIESCFVQYCDPEEEECSDLEEENITYYKELYRNSQYVNLACEDNLETCQPEALYTCFSDEPSCVEILCEPDELNGVICSSPGTEE